MQPSQEPPVTATTVLYNSADQLADLLRSIQSALASGFVELIAVDNASPDESRQIVADTVPQAKILRAPTNRGFAAGANRAWPHVRGRYWMLINPDVTVPEGGIEALTAWMDAHPGVGIASPQLAGSDGRLHYGGRAFPSIWLTAVELFRLHRLMPRQLRARLLKGPYWLAGDQLNVGWVPAAAAIVRSDAVETVGLLSESFFMYGEDIEWCARFRRAGWRVAVCSQVVVRHRERASAHRTWDAEETERRLAEGVLQAIRMSRGRRYAGLYARVLIASLWVEAHNPRRAESQHRASGVTLDAFRAARRAVKLP